MEDCVEMENMTLQEKPGDMDAALVVPFTLATIGVTLLTLFII